MVTIEFKCALARLEPIIAGFEVRSPGGVISSSGKLKHPGRGVFIDGFALACGWNPVTRAIYPSTPPSRTLDISKISVP